MQMFEWVIPCYHLFKAVPDTWGQAFLNQCIAPAATSCIQLQTYVAICDLMHKGWNTPEQPPLPAMAVERWLYTFCQPRPKPVQCLVICCHMFAVRVLMKGAETSRLQRFILQPQAAMQLNV